MAPIRKIPLREEWNFDAFPDVLTGRRLYFCFTYEYARCIPGIVKSICRERREGQPYDQRIITRILSSSTLPGEFPKLSGKPDDYDLLLTSAEFPRIPFLKSSFQNRPEESFPEIPETPAMQYAMPIEERWMGCETLTEVPAEEIHTFEIRWDRSPDAILSAFKRWLDDNHPREKEKGRGTNRERIMRTDLKALGVWRLLRCCNGDISKARKIVHPSNPEALYAREEDWMKARDRAQGIIDDWSERAILGILRPDLCRKTTSA